MGSWCGWQISSGGSQEPGKNLYHSNVWFILFNLSLLKKHENISHVQQSYMNVLRTFTFVFFKSKLGGKCKIEVRLEI